MPGDTEERSINNKKFRRFNLRGLKNVETEIGIISLAHNISKFAKKKGA